MTKVCQLNDLKIVLDNHSAILHDLFNKKENFMNLLDNLKLANENFDDENLTESGRIYKIKIEVKLNHLRIKLMK